MISLLGKKLGMSRVVDENGHVIPVTLVATAQNVITQIKTSEKDGYNAISVGFQETRGENNPAKVKYVREFKTEDVANFKPGQEIDLATIATNDLVNVQGISKGRGFAGVVKRHNFSTGPNSHGSHHHREPGSIGCRKPRRVKKGRKMPGRMGNDQVTLKKVPIVRVDIENRIIAIKGPLPGGVNSFIKIWA